MIQNNNIDQIKHIINLAEDKIKKEVTKNPVAVDHRKVEDHPAERDLVDTFEKSFNEIRSKVDVKTTYNFNKKTALIKRFFLFILIQIDHHLLIAYLFNF